MRNLIALSIFSVYGIVSLAITGIDAFNWPCESNSDCLADGSKCSTTTARCECNDLEAIFSSDYTKCLKTSLIGDQCEDSVQCNLMPSGAKCKSGVCDCADGESFVRGRCRPLNGLNQYCDSDLDCYFGYDRESVQCQNKICTCANGYYHRHGNICRRKSMDIGDVCVVATDCEDLGSNAKCVNLKCQLVDEIVTDNSNSNLKRDFKNNNLTNNNNNNNNTVTNNSNSSNNNNVNCTTTTTTSVKTPITQRQTSTTTSETLSILSKSSPTDSILDNRPQLVNGDSSTSSESDSTDNTSNINHNIIVNTKNRNTFTSDSESEKIAPKELESQTDADFSKTLKEIPRKVQNLREAAVQTSIETFELKYLAPKKKNVATATTTASTSSSSHRPSKQRRRPTIFRFEDDEKTFSTVSNTDDDNEHRNYGASCPENGKSCSGLPHSICSNSICLCKQGYYTRNGKCFAELGEIAESSDECENEFDAVTKKCICQKNYLYEKSLRECRKPVQFHLSCTSNSQCSPYGAAFCHPEIPRRCTCEEYAEYDALLEMCVYKKGLGSECDNNDACPIEHSVCSNRYCVCKDNYMQSNKQCVPGIGAECLDDAECSNVANSKCLARTSSFIEGERKSCQCRKGFVHFKDECLKEAEEIEEECEDTEQCKPLLATCISKKCSCTDEQHLKNGRCEAKKSLDESCTKASECFVEKNPENVECRNSVCQCKVGFQSNAEQKICYRVAPSKKNSSGRPSALKIITFMLIGSAFLITSAAIKQAYY